MGMTLKFIKGKNMMYEKDSTMNKVDKMKPKKSKKSGKVVTGKFSTPQ
tara:strand:- start:449 stop:592 length:144 start_codon:yes stop_codon:yes gene_type:complete